MFQASVKAQQKYIPGLTARPEDTGPPPQDEKKKPKEIPKELIDSFVNGTKQPVMCINEYCQLKRLPISFKEAPVDYSLNMSRMNKFASVCIVDGKEYPQGSGSTKKDAKTNAAQIAMSLILGLYDDLADDDCDEDVMFDSMGRKMYMDSAKATFDSAAKESIAKHLALQQHKGDTEIEKNPVMALQEYCANNRIPFKIEMSDIKGPMGFEAYVSIHDEIVGEGTALNKKESKRLACQTALQYLLESEEMKKATQIVMTEEDEIGKLCREQMHAMFEEVPQISHCHTPFAAFVVKKGHNTSGEVVAVGTGNSCLSKSSLTFDGRCMIDNYALATARRALLKYFFKEITRYFQESKIMSIFEQTSTDSPMLKLRDHVSIHLYLSEPPCGDFGYYVQTSPTPSPNLSQSQENLVLAGAHFPAFSDDFPGWFCTKSSDGEVLPVEEDQLPQQSLADIQDEGTELFMMSCSDKLLLWNVVGLQGALFSYYTLPVYLSSITVERRYDHGHFSRAVCCRVYEILQESLPQHYKINHPVLSTVSLPFTLYGEHANMLSMNWSKGDEKVEVVNGLTGKTDDISPHVAGPSKASRLCKAGFLHRFKELAKITKQLSLSNPPNYRAAKQGASKYQAAKAAFKSHCAEIGIGNWIKKPSEVDNFVK